MRKINRNNSSEAPLNGDDITLVLSSLIAQETTKAPNFALTESSGKTVELVALQGKVVVLNFWATWCSPCRAEIPGFLDVYKRYKSKGLEIVGIALNETGWKVVKPFMKKFNITYAIVIGDEDLVEAYGGFNAITIAFFIDKAGNIVEKHIGYISREALEKRVKELL